MKTHGAVQSLSGHMTAERKFFAMFLHEAKRKTPETLTSLPSKQMPHKLKSVLIFFILKRICGS